jgi:hypothetical protein
MGFGCFYDYLVVWFVPGDEDTHLMVCNNSHTDAVKVQYLGNKHEHHVTGMRKEPSFFPDEGLAPPLTLLQAKIGGASTLPHRDKRYN